MKSKTTISNLINLTIILFLLSNTVMAQETQQDSVKSNMLNNAIYGNVGLGGIFYGTATGYYERMFQKNAQKSIITTFVKVGYGRAASWHSSSYILGQFGFLTGAKKHHLEASAGLVKGLSEGSDFSPLSGLIGYRIQKPDGHFIFRTGVGWPEALYLGLGLSF